ncbi:DUF3885 domain-containing protein [Actinospica robiniae]|uniref:DUF3885 domain-containing protein n=1 Tax=Actinospica robiniae TaxID=304901 RepID=UPI00041D8FC6|nr:hypothetical protein [Actinospica robiniae]
MKTTEAQLAELDAAWERSRGGQTPLGSELGRNRHENWVRFHSLPESKRYAESEEEHAEILNRHYTVLRELASQNEFWVISARWTDGPDLGPDNPLRHRLHPSGRHWRTVRCESDEEATFWQLHASLEPAEPQRFEGLLRAVADYELVEVILADRELGWLYHPYDGGADVYARDVAQRDRLRDEHAAWLSKHPLGF